MRRQIALFAQEPESPDDIDRRTGLAATFALFGAYLRGEGKTAHTINAFLSDLRLLAEYAGGDMPIGDLRSERLAAFLQWMERERNVPCSRKTYARRVTRLKAYCKWLHAIDALAEDPAQTLRQRSGPAPLSAVLTDRQVDDCVGAANSIEKGDGQDYRPAFLLRLLLTTGLKKAECGRLKLADLESGGGAHPREDGAQPAKLVRDWRQDSAAGAAD